MLLAVRLKLHTCLRIRLNMGQVLTDQLNPRLQNGSFGWARIGLAQDWVAH